MGAFPAKPPHVYEPADPAQWAEWDRAAGSINDELERRRKPVSSKVFETPAT